MKIFGLIGYPLEHSFSPDYFTRKFRDEGIDAQYKLFPLSSVNQFPGLLEKETTLSGLNVTIPYKQQIIGHLNRIEGDARSIGAVNTIAFSREGEGRRFLTGYNTDAYGFEKALEPLLSQGRYKRALILGTGGSSKTIAFVLQKRGITWLWVTRSKQGSSSRTVTYSDLTSELVASHTLIINTTPLGMYPRITEKPGIPYEAIDKDHLLFDLVYNPEVTAFLKEGRKRGARVENGYRMLCLQAERSWQIWNNTL
jgi:shikimate dehydrogenase